MDRPVVAPSAQDVLGAVFGSLADGAILTRFPDRQMFDVNPALLAMTGYAREELVGRTTEVLHLDAQRYREFGERILPAFRDGQAIRLDWPLRRKDGERFEAQVTVSPLAAYDGAPIGVVAIIRDVTASRRAQRALRESEARWRTLVETASDYIYTVDREGVVLFLNRDAPGRPRSAIEGRPLYDWLPPEDAPRAREAMARAFETGQPSIYVSRARTAAGDLNVYETRVSPVRGQGGRVETAVVVSRELGERDRLRHALQRSEAKLQFLTEAGIVGIAVANLDGRLLEANDAFLRAIGHPRSALEAGALRWDAISAPETADADARALEELRERGAVAPYEKQYVRADGTRAHVVVAVALLGDGTGHAVALALDVSALRAAEAEAVSEARLARTILDAQAELGEGIALVGEDGRMVHTNDALLALTGYTRAGIMALPRPVEAVTAPEAAATWAARFAALARGEEVPPRFASWIRRKDGVSLPVEIVGTNVVYQGRRCRLYILRDLTDERAAQRQLDAARAALAQAEKLAALGTLVSGVAHEARTPMTAMLNASHLLQARAARGAADPATAPLLETIVESAMRLNGFLDELRRFTRTDVAAREPLSLDAPVRDALRLFALTHPALRGLEARLEPTPRVMANAGRIAQVVINLVDNAVDASAPGGPVRVATTATADGGAALVVEDEGAGMAPQTQARVFDPLFTTKPHGTGLGLAIVKRIAEEHGARIEIDSAPGKGTRVVMRFPPAPGA